MTPANRAGAAQRIPLHNLGRLSDQPHNLGGVLRHPRKTGRLRDERSGMQQPLSQRLTVPGAGAEGHRASHR